MSRPKRNLLLFALFAAVIAGLAAHFGEVRRFLALLGRASLLWLALAAAIQLSTFAVRALLWRVVLRAGSPPHGPHAPYPDLLQLNFAKHFADQAVPSGGISGTVLVVKGLTQRNVDRRAVMSGFVLQTIGNAVAMVLAVGAGLAVLAYLREVPRPLWIAAGLLGLISAAGVLGVMVLARGHKLPGIISRRAFLRRLLDATGEADARLTANPRLLAISSLLNLALPVIEAFTLWAVLRALGVDLGFKEIWVASAVILLGRNLAFLPSALGTFDAAAIAALTFMGVGFGPAVAASILARGVLLWLPLIPAGWALRRELHRAPA